VTGEAERQSTPDTILYVRFPPRELGMNSRSIRFLHDRHYAHGLLEAASLIFLFLPWLIFLVTHLRLWFSLPLCVTTAWGMILVYRDLCLKGEGCEREVSRGDKSVSLHYVLVFLLVIVLILYSGVGDYARQVADYEKHNAYLSDLIKYPWPLAFGETGREGTQGPVAYYLFYYLPAALVGKAFGWEAANHFTVVWGMLGASVAVCWFLRIVGKFSAFWALLFFFFGGLDMIGWLVLHGRPGETPLNLYLYAYFLGSETLNGPLLAYNSHLTILFWAPHQSLPVWIAMGILFYSAINNKNQRGLFFIASALPLWTSFGAVGTLPFVLLAAFQGARSHARGLVEGIKRIVSFQNAVAGPLLLLVATLFLSSNRADYPHGFLWQDYDISKLWMFLLLFYVIEFGVYLVVTPRAGSRGEWANLRPWLWTAVAILFLLPAYHLGIYNDFVMRTSLPSVFVLACCLAWRLGASTSSPKRLPRLVLVALLIIAAAPGFQLLGKQVILGQRLFNTPTGLRLFNAPNRRFVKHMTELRTNPKQYFGYADSFFFRHVSKPLEYQSRRYGETLKIWDFTDGGRFDDWMFPEDTRFTQAGAILEVNGAHAVLLHNPVNPINAVDVGGVRIVYSLNLGGTGMGVGASAPDVAFFSIRSRRHLTSAYPLLWNEADLSVPFRLLEGARPTTSLVKLWPVESWRNAYDMVGVRFTGPQAREEADNGDQTSEITVHRIEFVE
jgi:hypothetical protein